MKKFTLYLLILLGLSFSFTSCDEDKKDEPIPDLTPTPTNTVTDIDGNVYNTVTIGTQTWMVENLRVTKYNDGTSIPNVTDNTAWDALTTGAWCNYSNDAANATKYGKLYNWYATNTGKLAPAGWHVSTDAEWTTFQNYVAANLGTSSNAGKALAAKTDWQTTTDIGAIGNDLTTNNSSGFTGLPGGIRSSCGNFKFMGSYSYWWSSTEKSTSEAWFRQLIYHSDGADSYFYYKGYGMSVRCVKD